jgi:glucokinase
MAAPLVLTLDAGGTNFVFNAIQDFRLVLQQPVVLPAAGDDLDRSLGNLIAGFRQVAELTAGSGCPAAASFAFPGPADYAAGIVADLETLPAYRGAVPLGSILQKELGIPVYLNNDGDLFTYGVARHGEFRELNDELQGRGSTRRLASVVGMTLGTGWGCGFVTGSAMFTGSSSTGTELGECPLEDRAIEETVSRSGIVRLFREELTRGGLPFSFDQEDPTLPERIAALARQGSGEEARAARAAFAAFGAAFAVGMAWTINLLDPDLVVVGGGLTGAWDLFFPTTLGELRRPYASERSRIFKHVFDLESAPEREAFLRTEQGVMAGKKVGIARTQLDTAEAIMLGAYDVAITKPVQ